MTKSNHKREDGLSTSLQLAKAAEHLVCARLLLQGWNTFLADAGLPYDLVVDRGSGLFWRIQVKATCDMMLLRLRRGSSTKFQRQVYRFALRRSRTGDRRVCLHCADYVAFVALDIQTIAFLPVRAITNDNGFAVTGIEFKSRTVVYERSGKTGVNPASTGKFIQDFQIFTPTQN